MALVKAADAGLRGWTMTANGTSVKISTFCQLGCIFGTTYTSTTTKFKHLSQDYYVYVILDPWSWLGTRLEISHRLLTKMVEKSSGNSQVRDHFELLFSCIQSRGGWNNNPNTLQLKYVLRKIMLLRNSIAASKNANCTDFSDGSPTSLGPD